MKTNKEYRNQVEARFGKDLKDVIYNLCVVRNVVASEDAYELGVPKDTFNYWRNYYKFGPKQLQAKRFKEKREKDIEHYKRDL